MGDNMPKPKVDHSNTKCCSCGDSETYIKFLDFEGRPIYKWYSCKCGKKDCTRYICNKCHMKIQNRLPDSYHNVDRSVKNIRTGNLDKDSSTGKAIISQAVVCNVLGVEDLNIEMDNFRWAIDLENEKYGKIDVKGPSLSAITRGPSIHYYWRVDTNRKIDCDTYIILGFTFDRKYIEYVWIIPNDENMYNVPNIKIWRTIRNVSKYEHFKIDPKPYNDAYHSLMEFLKDKKYFGIEDIKKWLNKLQIHDIKIE